MIPHVTSPRAASNALRIAALTLAGSLSCTVAAAQVAAGSVVVTGSRFAEDLWQLPFGVSVLTADDLRRSGVATVNEALMKLLGVPSRMDLYGGGEYTLDVRGFGATADSNQVVVVDGMRISEGDSGGTRLAGIPIDSVQRIELLRGSGAVLYGEDATAGVIVITTRSGARAARRDAADVYLADGSNATRELRAGATLAAGGFSLDLAANRRLSEGHRDNFASVVDGASVAGQWGDERLQLIARHSFDELDTGLPGALTAAQYAADPKQTTTPDDHAEILNHRSSLQGRARLGDWSLALDAGWRDKHLRSLNSGFAYDYDITARQASVRASHRGRVDGLDNRLDLGIDDNRWHRAVLGDFGSIADQRNRALFVRVELQFAGGTRLSAGLRREKVDKTSNTAATGIDHVLTAWEIGAVQPLAQNWQVYGRVGDSFRLANADEFSFTAPGVELQPQTSRDLEIGARWRGESGAADVRAFRSALHDEIGFDPALGLFGANVNFERTLRQGVEAEARHRLRPTLLLRATAAWRQARFTAGAHDGRTVPLVPGRSATLGAQWQAAPAQSLEATVLYTSDRHPDLDNACRMPAVVTLDLRYAYALPSAEFALGVANAGDRRFYTQAFTCVAGRTSAIYPEPGRLVTASLRWRF